MVAMILFYFLFLLPLASAYPLEADTAAVNEETSEASWIKPAGKKLIFALALWRHGARAPNQMYPTSLNSIEDFIQEEGELLEKGMEEHFLLGLRLRQRYIKQLSLVSPRFRSKEVSIRSTGYNRTIASALTNFVSFYFTGNVKGKDYPGSIFWPGYYTPVPVYAVQWKDEDLFNYLRCPRALDLNVLIPQTPEFAAFVAEYQPLLAYLNNYSGMTITNSSAYANLNVAYR
uniref:Uncharacterized protein n=1 Tax=Panagrolaimus sp. ES5 TaxID=591445 RepID=A0AC34GAW6_9BILA